MGAVAKGLGFTGAGVVGLGVVALSVVGFRQCGETLKETIRGDAHAPAASQQVEQEVSATKICVTQGNIRLTDPKGGEWVTDSIPVVALMDRQCLISMSCPGKGTVNLSMGFPSLEVSPVSLGKKASQPAKHTPDALITTTEMRIEADPACLQSEVTFNGVLDYVQKGPLDIATVEVDRSCTLQLVCPHEGGLYTASVMPVQRRTNESPHEVRIEETDIPVPAKPK